MTELWRTIAEQLKAGTTATPELDARLLIAHACNLSPDQAMTLSACDVTMETRDRIEACASRRIAGEPVSRIVGKRGFWNHDFHVSPATLDPRPDSETLIEHSLRIVDHEGWRRRPLSILDLGTGTGCLLLTLLDELPNAIGTGIDISNDALTVARKNAAEVGCTDRVTFQTGHWFDGLVGQFDIVVSNPPYIPTGELNSLMADVRDHDPAVALDGGTDGLDAYRAIISAAPGHVPDGWLVLECGQGQNNDVSKLLNAAGYSAPDCKLATAIDLAGVPRCVAGRAHSSPR